MTGKHQDDAENAWMTKRRSIAGLNRGAMGNTKYPAPVAAISRSAIGMGDPVFLDGKFNDTF